VALQRYFSNCYLESLVSVSVSLCVASGGPLSMELRNGHNLISPLGEHPQSIPVISTFLMELFDTERLSWHV
jgi:hypothetical protein